MRLVVIPTRTVTTCVVTPPDVSTIQDNEYGVQLGFGGSPTRGYVSQGSRKVSIETCTNVAQRGREALTQALPIGVVVIVRHPWEIGAQRLTLFTLLPVCPPGVSSLVLVQVIYHVGVYICGLYVNCVGFCQLFLNQIGPRDPHHHIVTIFGQACTRDEVRVRHGFGPLLVRRVRGTPMVKRGLNIPTMSNPSI